MQEALEQIMDQHAEKMNSTLHSHRSIDRETELGKAMKVLVVEDDSDISELVSLCFETRWPDATVECAPGGEMGIDMTRNYNPDIIILDIGLPDIDGFEVCSRIRSFSDVPIVMLTVRDSREDIIKGLEIGADDYITKPFIPAELLARVKAVLRRTQMPHLRDKEMVFARGDLIIDFKHGEVYANNEPITLSPTEYQLFYQLVKNAGKVVASQALLDDIWGPEYRDEPYFLAARFTRLNEKLSNTPNGRKLAIAPSEDGYTLSS